MRHTRVLLAVANGFTLLLLALGTAHAADAPLAQWGFTYNGPTSLPTEDWALTIIQTSDGGYLAGGFSNSNPVNGVTPALVKLNAAGGVEWRQIYGDPGTYGQFSSVFERKDGINTYYVGVGFKRKLINSAYIDQVYFIRADSDGQVLVEKYIDFTIAGNPQGYMTDCYGACATPDGGYLVTGQVSEVQDQPPHMLLLMKLSSTGDVVWCKRMAGPGTNAIGNAIRPTYDEGISACNDGAGVWDGFIVVGECLQANWDTYIIRTDVNGNVVWSRSFDSLDLQSQSVYTKTYFETTPCTPAVPTHDDYATAVEQLRDGDFIVGAAFNLFQPSAGCPQGYPEYYKDADAVLLKIAKSDGSVIFAKNVSHLSGLDFNLQLSQVMGQDGFVLVGTTADPAVKATSFDSAEMLVVRTDASGNVMWRKAYLAVETASGENCGWGITTTADGGIVICGNNGDNGDDFVFGKLNAEGVVAWYPDCFPSDPAGHHQSTLFGLGACCVGPVGEAIWLPSNDYVAVTSADDLNFVSGDLTIMGWVEVSPTTARVARTIALKRNLTGGYFFFLSQGGSENRLTFVLGGSNSSLSAIDELGFGSEWNHVAVVANHLTGLTLYVNGIDVASTPGAYDPNLLASDGAVLLIGASAPGTNVYNGCMDELEFFDRPLSAQEIEAHALCGVVTIGGGVYGAYEPDPQPILKKPRYSAQVTDSTSTLVGQTSPLSASPTITRGGTEFKFARRLEGQARVTIWDVAGRVIRTLEAAPRTDAVRWDGRTSDGIAVRPGIYLARLSGNSRVGMTHVVVLR